MEYIALKDVCRINMGQSPESTSYNESGNGIPFFQGNADFGERYPMTRIWCNAPTKVANAGDILISVRAPIGALNYAKEKCCIGRGLAAITPDSSRFSAEFIYWFLKGKNAELNTKGTGSTFKAIGRKVLEETLVPNYGFEQQNTCAANLEKVYSIIQMRRQELQKLDEIISARFVEMFGDPVVNDRGWQKITLLESLEAGRTVTYGIVQTGDEFENGIPVFRPIDIAGGHIPKREELKKTDPLISARYKRTLLKGNELLITVRGSVGETFQTTDEFEGCNVGRNIVPLVTDSNIVLQRFLQELFAQDAIKNWLKGITKGIALQGLNMGEFKEMPVIAPPITMQRAFVVFALQVDKSKSVVQKSLDKMQLLFDSLMQQYFG